MIQNLMYTPTNARIALTFQSFQYDLSKHNKNIYIHPLIAALFIPLFPDLTDRMLNASFGNIVSTRYTKQSITIVYYTELSGMIIGHSSIIFEHDTTIADFEADYIGSNVPLLDKMFFLI